MQQKEQELIMVQGLVQAGLAGKQVNMSHGPARSAPRWACALWSMLYSHTSFHPQGPQSHRDRHGVEQALSARMSSRCRGLS